MYDKIIGSLSDLFDVAAMYKQFATLIQNETINLSFKINLVFEISNFTTFLKKNVCVQQSKFYVNHNDVFIFMN